MKSFFRNFRYSSFVVALLCVGLGLSVLLWPDYAMKVLCYGFGGVLILAGLLQVASYLLGERSGLLQKLMMLAAFISVVVGVWLMFSPQKVRTLAMIVMGVVLLYHGFLDIKYGFDIKGCQAKGSAMAVIFGVITCAIGVLMLVNPFENSEMLFFVAGLGFLVDGLTDLITVVTLAGAKAHYDRISGAAAVIELEPGAAQAVPVEGNSSATPALETAVPAEEPAEDAPAESDAEPPKGE